MRDSPSEPTIDLGCIGQALQRLTMVVANLCDDMHVLTAIVQRLQELRGMHRQYSRLNECVRQFGGQR